MKILYIITKSNWGGAQKYVFDLAQNAVKKDFEVAVALGGEGELKKKLQEININTARYLLPIRPRLAAARPQWASRKTYTCRCPSLSR